MILRLPLRFEAVMSAGIVRIRTVRKRVHRHGKRRVIRRRVRRLVPAAAEQRELVEGIGSIARKAVDIGAGDAAFDTEHPVAPLRADQLSQPDVAADLAAVGLSTAGLTASRDFGLSITVPPTSEVFISAGKISVFRRAIQAANAKR